MLCTTLRKHKLMLGRARVFAEWRYIGVNHDGKVELIISQCDSGFVSFSQLRSIQNWSGGFLHASATQPPCPMI